MFTDSKKSVISFLPNRYEDKTFKAIETQCSLSTTADKSTEPLPTHNIEIQTSELVDTVTELTDQDTNMFRVLAFLQKASPLIEEALIENQVSRAFDGYELLTYSESDEESKVLHQLQASNFPQMAIVALQWNCTGTAIAAAYGHSFHTSWCSHETGICIWYPNKSRLDVSKPHHLITTNGCVTAIAFHPLEPTTLAGATYYGDVYVWNLNQEDFLVSHALPSPQTHSEVVSQIRFMQINPKAYQLLTAGHDGFLIKWHKDLKPVQRYVIPASEAPPTLSKGFQKNLESSLMLTALDLEKKSELFLVGTEEGALFVCLFQSQVSAENDINPVILTLSTFQGSVTYVRFSPFCPQMALAAGSNGELRLYDTQLGSLLVTLHAGAPVLCAAWTRPLLVAVGVPDGLTCFTLPSQRVTDSKLQFKMENKSQKEQQGSNTTAMGACPNNPRLLAIGNDVGTICIWHLPTSLTSYDPQETKTLESFTSN